MESQTNLTVISAFLRPYEAVISANTGHILVHETGAIEATGHKIISIDVKDGKLNIKHLENVLKTHSDEHMVKPKLVYITNPTEIGSIYKKEEIKNLSNYCKENDLYFELANHANQMACLFNEELKLMGFKFLTHSPSNQIFPILPNKIIEELQKDYSFYIWEEINSNCSAIRLVTSWATEENKVLEFLEKLKTLKNILK